jgi:hypothetical protein
MLARVGNAGLPLAGGPWPGDKRRPYIKEANGQRARPGKTRGSGSHLGPAR